MNYAPELGMQTSLLTTHVPSVHRKCSESNSLQKQSPVPGVRHLQAAIHMRAVMVSLYSSQDSNLKIVITEAGIVNFIVVMPEIRCNNT